MTTRREFFVASSAVAASSFAPFGSARAQDASKQADFLFAQSAKGVTFDKSTNKLTLTGVSNYRRSFYYR